MKIVLFQPQIPQNTGNIVRTCSVTGCGLILIPPFGFSLSNRWLKRAGLDYWEGVPVEIVENLDALLEQAKGRFHLFSSKAKTCYTERQYHQDDYLIFGSETSGLPKEIMEKWAGNLTTIPMLPERRCLNLATSVGIAAYEAWRQLKFATMN